MQKEQLNKKIKKAHESISKSVDNFFQALNEAAKLEIEVMHEEVNKFFERLKK